MNATSPPTGPQGAQGAQETHAQAEAQEREKQAHVARWWALLAREPHTRRTREDRTWMEARAIITAHPDWGSKWLGLALGYDEDTAKKRGAYWYGRLAALGDLPAGARIVTRALAGGRGGPVDRDALAAGAHRNIDALAPVPPWLVQGLRTCATPDSARALLDRHAKEPQLDPAHYGAEYRPRPAATASSPARQGAPARQSGQRAQSAQDEPGEGWGGLALGGVAALVGIGLGILLSRGMQGPGPEPAPEPGPIMPPQAPGSPGQGAQGQELRAKLMEHLARLRQEPGSPEGPGAV